MSSPSTITASPSTITVKASLGSDTRRLRLPAGAGFKALTMALQPLFFPDGSPAKLGLTWTDEDGDVVTIASDADWAEASRIQLAAGTVVRVDVTATTAAATAAATPTATPTVTVSPADTTTTAPAAPAASKPVKPVKSFLSMLVDRSGSMGSLGAAPFAGIQTYLGEMKTADAEDSSTTSVLMATFDNKYALVHDGLDLPDAMTAIAKEDIAPRGMTALWDGIGFVLRDTEERIAALPASEKPDKVIVFILTDGQENTSQTWTKATVKRRMDALKAAPHNYEFFFAAAGQDALETGSHMGLTADECVTWSPDPVAARETFRSSAVNAVRCKRGQSRAYTMEQRSSCFTPARSAAPTSVGRGYGSYSNPMQMPMTLAPAPPAPASDRVFNVARKPAASDTDTGSAYGCPV